MLTQYRIRRLNSKNLVIQRQTETSWVTISYHGNNLNSLILGVAELIVSQHIPTDDNLSESLEKLRWEYVRGLEEIKEIIKSSEVLDDE